MLLSQSDEEEQFFTAYIDTKTNNVILKFSGFDSQVEAEIFLKEFVALNEMVKNYDNGSIH